MVWIWFGFRVVSGSFGTRPIRFEAKSQSSFIPFHRVFWVLWIPTSFQKDIFWKQFGKVLRLFAGTLQKIKMELLLQRGLDPAGSRASQNRDLELPNPCFRTCFLVKSLCNGGKPLNDIFGETVKKTLFEQKNNKNILKNRKIFNKYIHRLSLFYEFCVAFVMFSYYF